MKFRIRIQTTLWADSAEQADAIASAMVKLAQRTAPDPPPMTLSTVEVLQQA